MLHTWTRDLRFHPHVHCIVTGGGRSLDGSERVREDVALILYTRAADLARANAAYVASAHPIDVEMKRWQARAFDLSRATVLDIVLEHGQPTS